LPYLFLAEDLMGTPSTAHWLRFGASSLLEQILAELSQETPALRAPSSPKDGGHGALSPEAPPAY
jgi:hypothetical protein